MYCTTQRKVWARGMRWLCGSCRARCLLSKIFCFPPTLELQAAIINYKYKSGRQRSNSALNERTTNTMNFRTALVVLASIASSDAFSTASTFTRRNLPLQPTSTSASPSYPSSSSALSMNLFDRFTRVAKSNINNVLKSLEDPEKIMNQALEDMQVSHRSAYVHVCLEYDTMNHKEIVDLQQLQLTSFVALFFTD